jgi:dihydropteroate synthase
MTGKALLRGDRALVMGVVNVTPDSFSDGGRFAGVEAAVEQALRLEDEGADLLDIGGESTRPGAAAVTEEEELRRVAPVFERLLGRVGAPLSVDTMKAGVAEAALGLGARIVNDVTALRDPKMLGVVVKSGAAVVLMHMRGTPATMREMTEYGDVAGEVREWLVDRAEGARLAGVAEVAIDPGIGFAKTAEQSFVLLKRMGELVETGYPVVAGVSRKSFLGGLEGQERVEERLEGSLAAAVLAVMAGAAVVRVHDVRATRKALAVAEAVRRA